MPPRRLVAVLGLLPLALSNSGCCTLARAFCGPDRSEWVSVDRRSPRACLRTFLEALRRDDSRELYFCLSEDFKRRQGIAGMEFHIAYQALKEEIGFLHVAGYAELPAAPSLETDGACSYTLEVEGQRMTVQLVRNSYAMVRFRLQGEDRVVDRYLSGNTLATVASLEAMEPDEIDLVPRSRIQLHPILFEHPGVERIGVEQIDLVGYGRDWKIDDLRIHRE